MRELKFRAWVYYGERLKKPHYSRDYGSLSRFFEDHCENDIDQCIEQYTGLKDKNGKEIYEGDIVNAVGIGIAQVTSSPSGEWALYYKREPDEIENGFACVVPKNKPRDLWKTTLTSYIEIVGNIHENPELLGDTNVTNKEEE